MGAAEDERNNNNIDYYIDDCFYIEHICNVILCLSWLCAANKVDHITKHSVLQCV